MADRYYSDQPTFRRKDPLVTWSYVFLGIAGFATLWTLVLMLLWSRSLIGTQDRLWGMTEGRWVTIAVIALGACILGLLFVIVARIGSARGGGYLSTDLSKSKRNMRQPQTTDAEPATPAPTAPPARATPAPEPTAKPAARVDDPFGPDGRMLLSYTVPEQQPRGLYGDAWILVDNDAILNVRTMLAQSKDRPRRPVE